MEFILIFNITKKNFQNIISFYKITCRVNDASKDKKK